MDAVRSQARPPVQRRPRSSPRSRLEQRREPDVPIYVARGQLFLSACDPITVIALDGHYLDANHAACKMLGYSRDELLRVTAQEVNNVSDEVWQGVVANVLENSSRLAETVYHTKGGETIPVEVSVSLVTFVGRPALLSIARNIERRKRVESRIVEHNVRLSSLASGATRLARCLTSSTHDPEKLEEPLAAFVDDAYRIVPFDSVAIALAVPDSRWLAVQLMQEAGHPVSFDRLLVRKPACLEDHDRPGLAFLPTSNALENIEVLHGINGRGSARRGMVIPLHVRGRLFGLLSVGRSVGPEFTLREADDLENLANHLAVALDCTGLLDEIRALAVSEERFRIGREMHDRVGQSISCAAAFSSEASAMLRSGRVDDASWAIDEACVALQQAHTDLRESIFAFRAQDVGPVEWVGDLRQFLNRYEQQWGIRCKLEVGDGAVEACGAEGRVGLARILQEALANVRKHANTKTAAVSIALQDGSVLAHVTDHGRGFDPDAAHEGHFGLQIMRERARALGGDLAIASGDTGTHLWVRLPAGCSW